MTSLPKGPCEPPVECSAVPRCSFGSNIYIYLQFLSGTATAIVLWTRSEILKQNLLVNCLLDSLGTGCQTLVLCSLREFSISCQHEERQARQGGLHQNIELDFFFLINFNETPWKIWFNTKKMSLDLILHWDLS